MKRWHSHTDAQVFPKNNFQIVARFYLNMVEYSRIAEHKNCGAEGLDILIQ